MAMRMGKIPLFALALLAAQEPVIAGAQGACGLCNHAVVTNSILAECFLDRYDEIAKRSGEAIAVDLSDCSKDRGVVEALPSAGVVEEEPDLTFLVSRIQLSCLKEKLGAPGLVLDPFARIDLDDCG